MGGFTQDHKPEGKAPKYKKLLFVLIAQLNGQMLAKCGGIFAQIYLNILDFALYKMCHLPDGLTEIPVVKAFKKTPLSFRNTLGSIINIL